MHLQVAHQSIALPPANTHHELIECMFAVVAYRQWHHVVAKFLASQQLMITPGNRPTRIHKAVHPGKFEPQNGRLQGIQSAVPA
ncbi:hypothetical protein HRbin36_02273 [bacterium HR36]|nr:hypothetical protein HRbin36_02273 [bacterium HR36]